MNRFFKTTILSILSLSILCAGIYFIKKDAEDKKRLENTNYLGFSSELPSEKTVQFFSAEEISNGEFKYKDYNTYTYFSNLGDNERKIYKAFEYAFENSYQYVLFEEKLIKNTQYSINDILYFLSLDSPLVEQNLIKHKENFRLNNKDIVPLRDSISGICIGVENFSKNKLELKNAAIEEAQDIIDKMPQNLSDLEKSKYFYQYICDTITYKTYDAQSDCNYLYDALCKGVTQCDGYTNAYSLLCNMSNIPCFEKSYLPESREAGHTWNSIQIDDIWFNVDTTNASQLENNYSFLSRFCFSDDLQCDLPNWCELIPKCNQNVFAVDYAFKTENDSNLLVSIKEAFNNNNDDRNYIFFTIKNSPLSNKKLQEVSDYLGCDLNITRIEGTNQNIYFLMKDN